MSNIGSAEEVTSLCHSMIAEINDWQRTMPEPANESDIDLIWSHKQLSVWKEECTKWIDYGVSQLHPQNVAALRDWVQEC